MRLSTAEEAATDPLDHSVDGEGQFWRHDTSLSPGGYHTPPVHGLPHPPSENSEHVLLSPTARAVVMAWRDGLWFPTERISRLAYTPEYLGSQGWRYARPANPAPDKPRARSRKEKANSPSG